MSSIKRIIFSALLAFTVSSVVYFSFGNIYSSKILNFQDFKAQFDGGIYQYRILSGWFLIGIYEFLSGLNIDYSVFKFKFLNPNAEPQMYLAFYMLNTFFLMLTAVMMTVITESEAFVASKSEKVLLTAVVIFTIALSQFVIVPYDVASYFFLLLFFWILLEYIRRRTTALLVMLCLVLAVSTLNRESSALSVSLAATLLYSKFGLKKETLVPVAVLTVTFIAVYFGMRLINQSFSTNDGNLLVENFTQPKNYLGMMFWMVYFMLTLILANDRQATRNILIFHALSLPYIAMCFYTGILYEMRLYVPIFLTALFLAKIKIDE